MADGSNGQQRTAVAEGQAAVRPVTAPAVRKPIYRRPVGMVLLGVILLAVKEGLIVL